MADGDLPRNLSGKVLSKQTEAVIKTQVICEIGSNWETFQDIKDSIEFARSVGAIPKLQAYIPEEIAEPGEYFDKLNKHKVPREWMVELRDTGVFYSVFGLDSLAFLEFAVKPERYKIASPQATNKELIQAVARLGKETIISVGGCSLNQIRDVVEWFSKAHPSKLWWANLTLLHCVVAYPPSSELIGNLRDRINGSKIISWGLSSHSDDIIAPVMAVSLGATMIEKHFCLRPMDTPDGGRHSLGQDKFRKMVEAIETAERHLRTQEQPTGEEMGNLRLGRRV